jgi:hypothetical protein
MIEKHINKKHPTYLIMPTKPVETLKRVRQSTPTKPLDTLKRVRRSSARSPLTIEQETGAEQQPSHHSESIQNDTDVLGHTMVGNIKPADTGNSMDTKENHSRIDEAFENIEGKCLIYSSGQPRPLSRCKLCSKEIRRDRRKHHIRVNHSSYVFSTSMEEQPIATET